MTKKLKYRNISEIDVSSEQGKAYYRKVCANALVEKTNGDIVVGQALKNVSGNIGKILNHLAERVSKLEKSLYAAPQAPQASGVVI